MNVHLTPVSDNIKTGPMPVSTTEEKSCPDSCPLKGRGCYASSGPLNLHWQKVSKGERGMTWEKFCAAIEALPRRQIWRHNQAGDLPGVGDDIDTRKLQMLVNANKKGGVHGFTYTHKPITRRKNREAIRKANEQGFTINLSADTLEEADELAEAGVGPVVTVLPSDSPESLKTPQGRRVIVCPAQTRDRINCLNCRMCADPERTLIIGFRAHGTGYKTVERVIASERNRTL